MTILFTINVLENDKKHVKINNIILVIAVYIYFTINKIYLMFILLICYNNLCEFIN